MMNFLEDSRITSIKVEYKDAKKRIFYLFDELSDNTVCTAYADI